MTSACSVKMNQHDKCLGKRSSSFQVVVHTFKYKDTHTVDHCFTWTTRVVGNEDGRLLTTAVFYEKAENEAKSQSFE